jgi:hypothetical protein
MLLAGMVSPKRALPVDKAVKADGKNCGKPVE